MWIVDIYGTRVQYIMEDRAIIPILKTKNKITEAPEIPVLLVDWNVGEKDTHFHHGFNELKLFFFNFKTGKFN